MTAKGILVTEEGKPVLEFLRGLFRPFVECYQVRRSFRSSRLRFPAAACFWPEGQVSAPGAR